MSTREKHRERILAGRKITDLKPADAWGVEVEVDAAVRADEDRKRSALPRAAARDSADVGLSVAQLRHREAEERAAQGND